MRAHRDVVGPAQHFDRAIDVEQREVLFEDLYSFTPRGAQGRAPGDAAQAIPACRGPQLALANDEEMGRIACGDKAPVIEHQRLVGPRLHRLNAGEDAIEF